MIPMVSPTRIHERGVTAAIGVARKETREEIIDAPATENGEVVTLRG